MYPTIYPLAHLLRSLTASFALLTSPLAYIIVQLYRASPFFPTHESVYLLPHLCERKIEKQRSMYLHDYELPKRTIRANGNIYQIFKPNNFRDVLNIYQDKSSMDMTLNEFKLLKSTCWKVKYQPLTIDMTKDKYTGRYRLGLNSISVHDSSPF